MSGPRSVRDALAAAVGEMTEEQAIALYHAVAQHADNMRHFIDESEPDRCGVREHRMLHALETIERVGDAALAALAESEASKPNA